MSLVAAILDDVATESRLLANMVRASSSAPEIVVHELSSPDELGELFSSSSCPDILIIDICLGQESGIDLVMRVVPPNSHTQVIYTSGHDEFHTRVYATDHASFICKPARQEDVDLALGQAISRLEDMACSPLVLSHDHMVDVVQPRDIIYVESDRRHVIVHTRARTFRAYGKLGDLLDRLPSAFVRCHQSYVINLEFVERMGSEELSLTTGDVIPVSRRWRPSVRDALFSRVREGR